MSAAAMRWPADADALIAWQEALAREHPQPLEVADPAALAIGGCFVCFPRGASGPGAAGDPGWAAAAVVQRERVLSATVVGGPAGAPYVPGLLALREGALLEAAVRDLARRPDVLLVDATGRDHPRRAGLATSLGAVLDVLIVDATGRDHPRGAGLATSLGAVLDVPVVGVTHRTLVAHGEWPAASRGAQAPLRVGDDVVGCWLRTRAGARPLAIHPAWRIDLPTAVAVVLAAAPRVRTPAPLREARRLARRARI